MFGLEFNIINYLWFSRVGLFFYYLRSLIGWLPIFIGIQLRFYFYLYGLEYQYFFSILSKVFYVGMLIGLNILGREFFFCLGYFFVIFGILNYLLIRGIYFFSFSLLRQYFLALLTCALYVLVLHEFSSFSMSECLAEKRRVSPYNAIWWCRQQTLRKLMKNMTRKS